ncbi:MAG: hypothetical protein R2748_01165 [Bryobacterales bacterium]
MKAGAPGTRPQWAGLWLLYLVWFYPCWWVAQFIVVAGPELTRGVLSGAPPRVSLSGLGVGARMGESTSAVLQTILAAASGWAVCGAAARLSHTFRPVAALLAVWIAYALLGRGVTSLSFGGPAINAAGLAVVGFLALCAALARLPSPSDAPTTSGRAFVLGLVLAAPLCLYWLSGTLLQEGFRAPGTAWTLFAAAVATTFAARRVSPTSALPREAAAAALAVGVLAAIGLWFGASSAGRLLAARAEQARQASLASVPEPASLPPVAQDFYYRGVNFTSEWPEPYGSKSAAAILAELPAYGVNSVALVPYASQRPEDPELDFPLRMERDDLIAATAKMAHAQGLRVLLKPQIWVRGRGLYPGDLHYDNPTDRARWFASYARFVAHYAALATRIEADVFCVGVELAQLTPYDGEWRALIELARQHYSGPLVYAANFGEEFESVRFWDALDYIGLDNYYPLPEDRSVEEIAGRIEVVQSKFARPIVFTEAGFSGFADSHRKPWDDRPGGGLSLETQAQNVDAFLRGYAGRPWLKGIFWWKVGTSGANGKDDGSHLLWGKPAMDVIGEWFVRLGKPMAPAE